MDSPQRPSDGTPIVEIFIELKQDDVSGPDLARMIDDQLTAMDNDYKDLKKWTSTDLIRINLLKKGTFAAYLQKKQQQGADLAHWKPPHMNPSELIVNDLING
jgi:hypothetical protein